MKVSQVYNKKRSLSFEIFPPKKDAELSNIDATLEVLSELQTDFISVTFGAGGSSNCNRTIELAKKIKYEYGIEPVVLALRGDPNPNIPAKNDFRHSSDLISYLKNGNDFCFLGACYPECHPESSSVISEIKSLKKKVEAGAEVLLSQLFFDNQIFYRFHEECRIADIDVPVIPGVMPVINAAQIKRMVSLCNASFPSRFPST